MFFALTGLHRAGKSTFANTVATKHGFISINKNELLAKICKEETGSDDWKAWHKYNVDANYEEFIKKMVSYLPLDKNIILDSVHSNLEWELIKKYIPNAQLIYINSFKSIREKRWKLEENTDLETKDAQRIAYWHSNHGFSQCLISEACWCINGFGSTDLIERSFLELLQLTKENDTDQPIKIKKKGMIL